MDEQLKLMDQVTSAAIDMGIQFGPRLLVAVLILIAGVFAGRWARRPPTSFASSRRTPRG